ncbi:MAG TPA: prolipoprotein diacylglyceryl transferase family protein [Desulfomonilia bacterium]|nr:prolipoprotein diacylglyceryl transferase family protein [Desulfomonilia bacterium]
MYEIGFLSILVTFLVVFSWWGFTRLPKERWQFMASVPVMKAGDSWEGINLTWYGFFFATSTAFAVGLLYCLLRAISLPAYSIMLLVVFMLPSCMLASRLITIVVEGKLHGFTVGGATFVGIVMAPWAIMVLRWSGLFERRVDPVAVLAALAIAYAFGEGLGRFACISFGCCFGKPLSECRPWTRGVFDRVNFIFTGKTKKIAYTKGLDGVPVLPVQALTVIVCSLAGLISTGLFLLGRVMSAFLLSMIVTQLWRAYSETLRADYRGEGKVSAYQKMSVIGTAYAVVTAAILNGMDSAKLQVNIAEGITSLWNPFVLLALQAVWTAVFLYTGKSTVTGSSLTFHVFEDRV